MATRKKKATKKRTAKKATKKRTAKKATKKRTANKATKKRTAKKAVKKATKKKAAKKKAPSRKLPRELLSMRAYAAKRKAAGLPGGSHVAVMKAIEQGRLTTRSSNKKAGRWYIDPIKADKEWSASTQTSKTRDPGKMADSRRAASNRQAAELLEEGASESQSSLFGDHDPRTSKAETEASSAESNKTTASANRALAHYKAQMAALDFKERCGKLVDKDGVDAEVFSIFVAARDQLLAIPERVAAMIAAETNPHSVRTTLRDSISRTLKSLSDDLKRL